MQISTSSDASSPRLQPEESQDANEHSVAQDRTDSPNSRLSIQESLYRFAQAHGRDPGSGSLTHYPESTRNEQTHAREIKELNHLIERYCKSFGEPTLMPREIDPILFVGFILKLMSQVRADQRGNLKRLCKLFFKRNPHPSNAFALRMLESEGKDSPVMQQIMKSDYFKRLNAKRLIPLVPASEKQFPYQDFVAVLSHLKKNSNSKYRFILTYWLQAGVATGLRPIEWKATVVDYAEILENPGNGKVLLHVLNAKSTNGRANGLVRILDISLLPNEYFEAVRFMSVNGRKWLVNGTFEQIHNGCIRLLSSVCKKLFKHEGGDSWTRYVLYSTRHQFILNASVESSENEVSDLVGHGSTDTASKHYGLGGIAWAKNRICKVQVVLEQDFNLESKIDIVKELDLQDPMDNSLTVSI